MIITEQEITDEYIDISNIHLVKFIQECYNLSIPVGMGFIHYTPEPLTDEEAIDIMTNYALRSNDPNNPCVLSMDYVKGRCVKMHVIRRNERLYIRNNWYDHTPQDLATLLHRCNWKVS